MVSCGGSGTLVTSGVGVVVTVPGTEVDTVSDGEDDKASPKVAAVEAATPTQTARGM
jgi:hypothetical protein